MKNLADLKPLEKIDKIEYYGFNGSKVCIINNNYIFGIAKHDQFTEEKGIFIDLSDDSEPEKKPMKQLMLITSQLLPEITKEEFENFPGKNSISVVSTMLRYYYLLGRKDEDKVMELIHSLTSETFGKLREFTKSLTPEEKKVIGVDDEKISQMIDMAESGSIIQDLLKKLETLTK